MGLAEFRAKNLARRGLKDREGAAKWRNIQVIWYMVFGGVGTYFILAVSLIIGIIIFVVGYLIGKEIEKKAYEPLTSTEKL